MLDPILIARGTRDHELLPRLANRHGLVAGATGTGKTVSLRVLAEGFSRLGVPVFLADVKGDLSGLSAPGGDDARVQERAAKLGISGFAGAAFPVAFWDVGGRRGHPIRTTISEMGPVLLARLLNLNDTQSGVMQLVFRVADDEGLLLLDLKDLRALLQYAAANAAQYRTQYGTVSSASVGAIQRALLALEEQGGDDFFGEPALELDDLLQTDANGRGVINVLAADRLIASPKVYSTLLLWILSELFESLPEVGDPEKPRLVFFFDEAHLLFADAPAALLEKIEQVVRLIRSKGVGVYFCTQSPLDLPDAVLGQLGHRVQHALRAFTPRDQKVVKAAAQTFRANPGLDVAAAITELGVGEVLISLLDGEGRPGFVDRALVMPPTSRLGPLTDTDREAFVRSSPVHGHYEHAVDRESAYERLAQRAAAAPAQAPPASRTRTEPASETEKLAKAMAQSAARSVGSSLGRQLIRGVLGSLLGGSGGRRR